ncbi:NUDIX domain-containing protein [Cellulomonas marina]|uniref:NUDIX domain-containing protein n=1 Tax=Cellulomonas marina TaxID=988821 RepID=UPI001113E17B|nr:NUDIX domain-containing protein [Cellulomonas marina]GIG29607.1 NUDIX hydrolase [Cellulomonas marina]
MSRDEHVLVVPNGAAELLFATLTEEGLSAADRDAYSFVSRIKAEVDPSIRQVIPYVAMRFGDEVLAYTRLASGNEGRLHGRISIGWGGHVGLVDAKLDSAGLLDPGATIGAAAQREVGEELGLLAPAKIIPRGVILHSDSAVDRVHVGLLIEWQFDQRPKFSADASSGDVGWVALRDLRRTEARLETWSRSAARILSELAEEASNTYC